MRPFTALLYGIHPVLRRLGAFTLSCLLAGPDSRRIFEAEEGRGYDPIQCTAWCRDAKAKEYAVSAMNRVSSPLASCSVSLHGLPLLDYL